MTVSASDYAAAHATLNEAIARLRSFSQLEIQASWRWCEADLSEDQALDATLWNQWAIAPLNQRHHVAWACGQKTLWLAQRFWIPRHLNGFPTDSMTLRLALSWWAEDACIYINGIQAHTGDLFDCFGRILLTSHARPDTYVDLAIRLVSPGHDDGALVRSCCLFENPDQSIEPAPEPGFVADELAVLQNYISSFSPERLPQIVTAVEALGLDLAGDDRSLDPLDPAELKTRLQHLRQQLLPIADWIKQRTIHLLGHAHLDLAWLWPISETWDAAQRTFESVLTLQKDFPELVFTHSTPALYRWLETHRPDMLDAICNQVQQGRWEVGAGLWVEPEFNIVSGESIVRQVLYGQRYAQHKFGQISRIAWLPDSFGFCWQLPQILALGGIDYFATQKLRWNDTTAFPYELFQWRSPDGTTLTSMTLPPIGSDVNPVKMADYASHWEQQTGHRQSLWLPGVGDHGGGPSRDMLTVARRWSRSPFFPQITFMAAQPFLDSLCESASPELLPVWDDELYLELHRGCYTTHAEQKRWNRRCEVLLYQAELFAAIATLTTKTEFPHAAIEQSWKHVLFNQFHDILPGSAIPAVYEEANLLWQQAETTAEHTLREALEAIAQAILLPPPPQADSVPLVLFNSLTWDRSEVITVAIPDDSRAWSVIDAEGQARPTQRMGDRQLRFQSPVILGVGYGVVWLCPGEPLSYASSVASEASLNRWTLENAYLHITVNPATGDLASVFDKLHQRHLLNGAGNQLQAFRDQGQYWDAWNIAPDYADHPLPASKLLDIRWIEQGNVQQRLRVVRQIGRSPIQQDYVLNLDEPLLRIETEVNWQEDFTLLKAAFPVNFIATEATTEMPCGAIARPLDPQTPAERAKWEVPALNWADLSVVEHKSNGSADCKSQPSAYGVSLLSDYKHGYDFTPHRLRLTLLKSPKWPDPNADRGLHRFTYALYPHGGTWAAAHTTRQGYSFNQPLLCVALTASHPTQDAVRAADESLSLERDSLLPSTGRFIHLPQSNLVLMAFKPEEPESEAQTGLPRRWMLRCYETQGQPGAIAPEQILSKQFALRGCGLTNLLEQPIASPQTPKPSAATPSNHSSSETDAQMRKGDLAIAPWKIVTLGFEG